VFVFNTDVKKTANQPIIVQSLPVSVENEHILLFDDVADSGHTLSIAKNYLQMCGAEKIISATLFIKSWAKFLPDYYAETTDAWIIFPHEIREMINLIGKKWGGKYSQDEITQRFITMGMQKDQIKYFLSLQEYNKDK
jgi:hypoxanthine phosphoribosyltransferase